ncbi:MAG: class I SAM-dependent methyltransferase [Ktedonobacteraceae bacterium]|nr:class I SAM-dependent methyltransferase [Ktedonobacteraceae bacterium]
MTESQPADMQASSKTKKVSIQERSVRVGNFIVVNGSRANHTLLKERFTQGGYQIHETPHFLLFQRIEAPSTILVHWFTSEHIDTDVSHYLVQELKSFGIIASSQHLSELLTGIVGGTLYPDDVRRAWNYFGVNTLQRLLTFLNTAGTPCLKDYGTLSASATLYQRVCELCVGESFLDAACNGGFLSLLLAERLPFVVKAVGIDIDADVFVVAQKLAEERHMHNVAYQQADLLADDFDHLGSFDTVTALHVLEHFSEDDMYRVLTNLLRVTSHRLILAVPYEHEHDRPKKPEVAYGHQQFFSRAKLEAVGEWCLQQLQGAGRVWHEDFIGGLLLIERR